MKILHVINGLDNGGAEGVLIRLILRDREFEHRVISLGKGKYHLEQLRRAGVVVFQCDFRNIRTTVRSISEAVGFVKAYKPTIIQTWLYHSDFFGALLALVPGSKKGVLWNVRNSDLSKRSSRFLTRKLVLVLALLSWIVPKKILCCSLNSIDLHVSLGYSRKKFVYVPNGIDTNLFCPDPARGIEYRNALFENNTHFMVGMAARFDPQKDHSNLLMAITILVKQGIPIKLLLVGTGVDDFNSNLVEKIEKFDLSSNVKLIGREEHMADFYNALDCHVLSSSYGEAFPNVIAEAMSCGTICVATDVGDTRYIIDDTGIMVERENAAQLAEAILKIFKIKKNNKESFLSLKRSCRQRVVENYSIDSFLSNYKAIWNEFDLEK